MYIEQLRYLIEVAYSGSMTLAAENLFTTQSNISKAISNLEKELGHSLFIRYKGTLTITDFGMKILMHAKNILSEINEIHLSVVADATTTVNSDSGTLTILFPQSIKYLLSCTCASFHNIYPNISLVTLRKRLDKSMLKQYLADNIADIIFFTIPYIGKIEINNNKDNWKFLFSEKVYLLAPANSPLKDKKTISLKELSDLPLATTYEETNISQPLYSALKDYNCNFSLLTSDSDMLLDYIKNGKYYALVTKTYLQGHQLHNFNLIPIAENFRISTFCVYNDSVNLTGIEIFLETLKIELLKTIASST